MTIEQGFNLLVAFYQEVKIAGDATHASDDDDTLLFQYSIWNWHNACGEYFGLDITRQVIFEEEGEQVICQLSFEFEFDAAPFSGCRYYTSGLLT